MNDTTPAAKSSAPITLRSAGVAPRPVPVRLLAWATYEVIRHGVAIVEVNYVGRPDMWSSSKVEIHIPAVRRVDGIDPLYEAAYRSAAATAAIHGYVLDRFCAA